MLTWATAISVLKYVVTLGVGFAAGFLYFAFCIAKDARPLSVEFIERMVKLHKQDGLFSVLVGRRQMIDAVKHQVEAHGLSHKDDILAWLAEMDKTFLDEQTKEAERVGVEARRQLDDEEAQAKGGGE